MRVLSSGRRIKPIADRVLHESHDRVYEKASSPGEMRTHSTSTPTTLTFAACVQMTEHFREHAENMDHIMKHLGSYSVVELVISIIGAGMASDGPLLPFEVR